MNVQTRLTALALSLTMLAGCALLTDRREEVVVYSLRLVPRHTQEDTATQRAWQLIVTEPQAMAPLDGTRMVVMPKPGEMQFYHGARWRDDVPAMLQTLLIQAHEDRVNVTAPGSGMHADFSLRTTLRDFQAEYRVDERAPVVVVGLAAQLISAADGRLVANRTFRIEQPAAGTSVAEVFVNFEGATDRLCAELVEWSLAAGDVAWSTRAHK